MTCAAYADGISGEKFYIRISLYVRLVTPGAGDLVHGPVVLFRMKDPVRIALGGFSSCVTGCADISSGQFSQALSLPVALAATR